MMAADRTAVAAAMDRVNPVYIPRNHRVEEALAQATAGEMGPFHRLLDAVSRPFEERPGLEDYAGPAPDGRAPYVTYCGT
jgi:protein adenylyltransferase